MAVGRVFENPILKEIAARNGRTIAQVDLRWLIQQPTVIALSRTKNLEKIPENMKVFDFELGNEDMRAITRLRMSGSRIVNPAHLAPVWDQRLLPFSPRLRHRLRKPPGSLLHRLLNCRNGCHLLACSS